jgi:hypothetical protein
MSKVDAMRALREARRAAATSGPAAAPARTAARAAAPPRAVPAVVSEAAGPSSEDGLCGHRNMGGRSCTRELDHVKNGTKNHRYG